MQETDFSLVSAGQVNLVGRIWLPDEPARAVVCLVHGQGEHSGRYAHVARVLTAAGYVILALDLPGHGRSGGKRGGEVTYENYLSDVQSLLDTAARRYPDLPVFLYGHSMGGNLVLNFVLRRKPVLRGVIATGPWLRLAFAPSPALLLAGRVMYKLAPNLTMKTNLDTAYLSRDHDVVEAYIHDPLVHSMISAQLGLDIGAAGEWALAHASQFPLPLFLAHGGADAITSPAASRQFAAAIPGERCTLTIYDNLYHEIHNEPEQGIVLADITAWMQNRLMA
jgi:alpha-beta hydrolase superfamily lysophospholipase